MINRPFWGTPIPGNLHVGNCRYIFMDAQSPLTPAAMRRGGWRCVAVGRRGSLGLKFMRDHDKMCKGVDANL